LASSNEKNCPCIAKGLQHKTPSVGELAWSCRALRGFAATLPVDLPLFKHGIAANGGIHDFCCSRLEYPKEVSPLARDRRDKPGLTERFECIIANRELANGFTEFIDPDEQRARFEDQARVKAAGDSVAMVHDEDYIRAMECGLSRTGGIGFG